MKHNPINIQKNLFILFLLLLLFPFNLRAINSFQVENEKDSLYNREKSKNLKTTFIAGPSYTPDYGFIVGGTALMTFKLNPSDSLQLRSVIPAFFSIMFKGGFSVDSQPELYFKGDKFRIRGLMEYRNTKDFFYGIGYSEGKKTERNDSVSSYRYNGFRFNPQFMFRLKESNLFIGPEVDISYEKFINPGSGLINSQSYQEALRGSKSYSSFSSGLGLLITYDSRDVPANPYRGCFLTTRGLLYQKFLGSDLNFYKLNFDFRQYLPVGHRRVFAWTIQSKHVFGDIPLNHYTFVGTPYDLRGYYIGQFRDKSAHIAMGEYRHMINTNESNWMKKMVNRMGFVLWGGCAALGTNPIKLKGLIPNYGVGFRFEVQPRMNIRVDWGRNPINKESLIYFNMTEAF